MSEIGVRNHSSTKERDIRGLRMLDGTCDARRQRTETSRRSVYDALTAEMRAREVFMEVPSVGEVQSDVLDEVVVSGPVRRWYL